VLSFDEAAGNRRVAGPFESRNRLIRMNVEAKQVEAGDVRALRELYRREANCQLIRDSFLARGFADSFAIEVDGRLAGYGLVANKHDAGRVIEFYPFANMRGEASRMFRSFLDVSGATHIEAQTNVPWMLLQLNDWATNIQAEKVLFQDKDTTHLPCPEGGVFRGVVSGETLFEHHHEPVGDWVLEMDEMVVATGGFLSHYNPPFSDIYMEVNEAYRRRGVGSYLIQEVKRICYESGKSPAARCDVGNLASRRALERAGLLACGHLLFGAVRR
jgi:GNAT superfamily N-acetyltransferase